MVVVDGGEVQARRRVVIGGDQLATPHLASEMVSSGSRMAGRQPGSP